MNYIFYDTEGTGTNTRYDQALQFAAIVTNEKFEEIATIDIRSKLLPHVIPSPKALEVTGVDPYKINEASLTPMEFAKEVHSFIKKFSPSIITGQNILNYDEELMRTTFYMNLLDPYITSAKGTKRLDTFPLLRSYSTIDPDAIKIPDIDGKKSFKLDRVAPLNGFTGHNAHDALGDVRATIFMVKILKENNPKLFDEMFKHCDPDHCARIINENRVFHLMTHFGAAETLEMTRICTHPTNKKQEICFDLRYDPTPLLGMNAQSIADMMGSYHDEDMIDSQGKKMWQMIRTIKTNQQPAVFEANTLTRADNPIDQELILARLKVLQDPVLINTIKEAVSIRNDAFVKSQNVEEQIYDGFSSFKDKKLTEDFHKTNSWETRKGIVEKFEDSRLKKIGYRLILSEAQGSLPNAIRLRLMQAMIKQRILAEVSDDKKAQPWNTLPKAISQLHEVDDEQTRLHYKKWYLEKEAESVKQLANIELSLARISENEKVK